MKRKSRIFRQGLFILALSASFAVGAAQEIIFENWNALEVLNDPPRKPGFTLSQGHLILSIKNNHWNEGRGTEPGQIGLQDASGRLYGPWPAEGEAGSGGIPNASWIVRPNIILSPGTYTILDSDPETWAWNAATGGCGMSRVEGPAQDAKVAAWTKSIAASASDQVIDMESALRITLPADNLRVPRNLTVRPAPDHGAAGEEDFAFKKIGSYEIALDDQKTFSKPLTLEVPFDPGRLNPAYSPGQQIVARRWDEARNRWIYLPCRIDTDRNRVITTTDHLTLIEWITIGVVVVAVDAAHGVYEDIFLDHYGWEDFLILYDKKAIQSEFLLDDKIWKMNGGGLSESQKIRTIKDVFTPIVPVSGEPLILEPLKAPQLEVVPLFIKDLGAVLEEAHSRYAEAKLDKPEVPLIVKVDSRFIKSFSASGAFDRFYRRIHLDTDHTTNMNKLKIASAHELFHAYQFQILGFQGMTKMTSPQKTWWLESTADYAAVHLAWNNLANLMGAKKEGEDPYPKQLEYKLSHVGSPDGKILNLEYDKAFFIDFLAKNGMDFPEAFKTVTPGADSDPLVLLDQYLKAKKGAGLAEWYQRFAAYFLLSRESPIGAQNILEKGTMEKTDPFDISPSASTPEKEFKFGLLRRYTTQVWGIHIVNPSQPQDGPGKIEVEADRLYGPGAALHVYVLKGNRKAPAASVKPDAVLSREGQKEGFEVHADDGIYILAFNTSLEKTAIVIVKLRALNAKPEGVAHYEEFYGDEPQQGKSEEFDFILLPPEKFFAQAARHYDRPPTDEEKRESETSNSRMLMNLNGEQVRKSLLKLSRDDVSMTDQWMEKIGKGELWIFYHGTYVRYNPNGTKDYQREFVSGLAHGEEISYHKDGKIKEKGRFDYDRRQGEWQAFDEAQRPTETTFYEKNEPVWRFRKTYFPSGTPAYEGPKMIGGPDSTYPNVQGGPFVEYHENGQPRRRGQYRLNKGTGTWEDWDKKGALIEKRVYVDPPDPEKNVHLTTYDTDGRILDEGYFDGLGRKHGTWTETRGLDSYSIVYDHGMERKRSRKKE